MNTGIPRYGRAQFPLSDSANAVEIEKPDGTRETALPFLFTPCAFEYDRHGYERVRVCGAAELCFRYTPDAVGEYRYRADDGSEGAFTCTPSEHAGYVCVSKRDPRYFTSSEGQPYAPVGPNLCLLRGDALPAGSEHFAVGQAVAYTGLTTWRRWFAEMKACGANYTRIWLSSAYLDARTELPGVHDPAGFARLDALLELAREAGVRVKLCLEHFRTLKGESFFAKRLVDPDTGRRFEDARAWLTSETWNERWFQDILPYLARYQNDPVVFAWELWNEMNGFEAPFDDVLRFSSRMLARVRALSPKNMAVNSVGSYDEETFLASVKAMRDLPEASFGQIHRYLDQGAPLTICRADPVALSVDAVRRLRDGAKPLLLTETGAVNDRHTGPFRYYACDHAGRLFADFTFPPFFAGAAGSGHIWHWDSYVDAQNLWDQYTPLVRLLEGLRLDEEGFEPFEIYDAEAWILGLRGKTVTLFFVRSRLDRWDYALRDLVPARKVRPLRLPLPCQSAKAYWLMHEREDGSLAAGDTLDIPAFTHGLLVRVAPRE